MTARWGSHSYVFPDATKPGTIRNPRIYGYRAHELVALMNRFRDRAEIGYRILHRKHRVRFSSAPAEPWPIPQQHTAAQ
jgi:hypothetical protein